MNVFLAGAAGAIGRRLVPLLLGAGHRVTGTTRSGETAAELKVRGVAPVVVDVFDADGLRNAVVQARPDAVIHQLTDLPKVYDPDRWNDVLERNSRLRVVGTANLVAAAQAAGARRLIAQSIAFAYAPGPEPHAETDPLAAADGTPSAITARGVRALEAAVLGADGIDGVVLRYGRLYGPGTWHAAPSGRGALHVDAAAHAALLSLTAARPGVYNIAEADGVLAIDKARQELGFHPGFRLSA